MAKRGRQSGAELSVIVDLSRAPPPPPPDDLPPTQATTWRNTVGCLPSGYITKAAHPVLVQLCRHVDRSRALEELIAAFRPEWCSSDEGLARLDKLLAMAEREGRAIV